MPTIEDIRRLDRQGVSGREIARVLGVSRDSVAKYAGAEDLSVPAPRPGKPRPARVMTPRVCEFIDQILESDKHSPRKQRHTAKRIFDRLVAEQGFTGSYRRVTDYVRRWKQSRQSVASSYAELSWQPGSAQIDFGDVHVYNTDGVLVLFHMLVLTLPFSNARFAQLYRGETSECVAHGLRAVYEHIGFVPPLQVFDNATGIGRRVGKAITESALFSRFRAHYRFESRFCNPYSGNEKGNVENAVGFLRRNLLTPIPILTGLESFNQELLAQCDGLLQSEHYRKKVALNELMNTDRSESLPLPATRFSPVRYEVRKADKEGRIKFANNYYLAGPELYDTEITIGITHDSIQIYAPDGPQVRALPRCFTHEGTTITEPEPLLALLATRPGSWKESLAREVIPAALATSIDQYTHAEKRRTFKALTAATVNCGFVSTMNAATMLLQRGDPLTESNLTLIAKRSHLAHEQNPNVDLGVYDTFTQGKQEMKLPA